MRFDVQSVLVVDELYPDISSSTCAAHLDGSGRQGGSTSGAVHTICVASVFSTAPTTSLSSAVSRPPKRQYTLPGLSATARLLRPVMVPVTLVLWLRGPPHGSLEESENEVNVRCERVYSWPFRLTSTECGPVESGGASQRTTSLESRVPTTGLEVPNWQRTPSAVAVNPSGSSVMSFLSSMIAPPSAGPKCGSTSATSGDS